MDERRSQKVRRILQLEGRAARLRGHYAGALARISPLRHRAEQLEEQARAVKTTLTPCELHQLRRARSGV
jgi:hypothetical protein